MSVLVTGGTGFLGNRLVKRLLMSDREVSVLARKASPELEARGVRFIQASLSDSNALRFACNQIDTVYHIASRVGVWGTYEDFYRTNVEGTRRLLEVCRSQGVKRLIYTSTPSVVYSGRDLAGANETLPLTQNCPSHYPTTKAIAEREVLAANSERFRTIALRPHLIWGVGDPHLVPRLLARARAGRLRIVGQGQNQVDMVHVENVVDAHLLAEHALAQTQLFKEPENGRRRADGRAFFITNGEPVKLWHWINELLVALGEPPVTKKISLPVARAIGGICEAAWQWLPLRGEPPMTRFIADELAKDHWFDISLARRDLNYVPRVSMLEGTAELVLHLRKQREGRVPPPSS